MTRLRKALGVMPAAGIFLMSTLMFAQQEPSNTLPRTERCTQNCPVAIEGLQESYQRGEHLRVSVRNRTEKRIFVDVAVDGQDSRGWIQIMASVSEPNRPFADVVRAIPIPGGKARAFTYDPWTALDDAKAKGLLREEPRVLRLMVHVLPGGEFSQEVPSKTFRLVKTRDSH
jgi:hypothetical protein